MLDVPNWLSEVQNQGIPDSIEELEEAVARFDDLHAAFNTFYNEVWHLFLLFCFLMYIIGHEAFQYQQNFMNLS